MAKNQHDITQHVRIDEICMQFERALRRGETPDVDELLAGIDESGKSLLIKQLLLVEFEHLERAGDAISLDYCLNRFPRHESAVREAFQQYHDSPIVHSENHAPSDHSPQAAPLDATVVHSQIVEQPGSKVGKYKLLEQIGEGGMGVVYMAQQDEPVRRRVALKIIKPGMDSRQVVARFEAERQALAMMDHPNIAKVLDAGSTESNRPYFVMELVKGVPVTQYCDEHRLNARQRMLLFASICRAVQHAHQKGIIHRDLKPSNVLVAEYDHQPISKIIDFGVAKATSLELTEKTLFTQFGQIVGTLDYMSPEQAKFNQLDIDTRSDVYSLGVLLYELLTGGTPIEKGRLQKTGLEEILRIIREEDPPRPSTRLNSSATLPALAECRSTDPRKLALQLREDLDWIVVKALAKERNERYQTAAEFADDIERHLQDRPIEARRPSTVGRFRRYVRRHKTAVALTTLAIAAAVMAVTLGVIAYVGRLDQERQRTALQATRAQAEISRLEAERKNAAREVDMPRVKQLLEERRHVEAFQLASEAREVLAGDPAFNDLWKSLTVEVSLSVEPPGTAIYYRGARDVGGEWLLAGRSPLLNVRCPKTDLRFRFVKEGFVTLEFQRPFPQFTEWVNTFRLRREQDDPAGMVFVHGSQPASWNSLPTAIAPFFIDRYEVSNAEFQAFVDAGGYENPEFWSDLEFVDNGQSLTYEVAMERFRDAGGFYGPAGWHAGEFPLGEDDYPVGGVSWFEAMAYARFIEKSLPTVYHWKSAGRSENIGITTALSNFSDRGPTPRGAQEGIGVFEVYDMAGNLKEWCFTEDDAGRRYLKGGAWNESDYRFGFDEAASPWDRSFTNGFRCVRYLGESAPETLTLQPVDRPNLKHAEVERESIESLVKWYQYDRGDLNVEELSTDSQSSDDYRYEVVRVDAAYKDERLEIHLFLPQQELGRYETIVYVPGLGVWNSGGEFRPGSFSDWRHVADLPASGRILCIPIYEGTYYRWSGRKVGEQFAESPLAARDDFIAVSKEVSRAVDYLLTRPDVDPNRLVYFGQSLGAMRGPATLVTEPRFTAAVLLAGGYTNHLEHIPEIDSYQFTPHVTTPVLMINGVNDGGQPYETSQLPFFEDLGSEVKNQVLLSAGHNPPADDVFKEMDNWLKQLFDSDAPGQ